MTDQTTRPPGEIISDQTVAEVRERTDIVDLIRETVADLGEDATRPGWFLGTCPWCTIGDPDEGANLEVRRERGVWQCINCGHGGDALGWTMQPAPNHRRRSYFAAVEHLAGRLGLTVEYRPYPVGPVRATR